MHWKTEMPLFVIGSVRLLGKVLSTWNYHYIIKYIDSFIQVLCVCVCKIVKYVTKLDANFAMIFMPYHGAYSSLKRIQPKKNSM